MMRLPARIALATLLIGASSAQLAPAATRAVVTVLQRTEIPGTNREMRMMVAEFPPGAVMRRHESTDPEMIYMLSGRLAITADGKAPVMLRAGASYTIPAHTLHETAAGPTGAKVLAFSPATPGK